jgi:uncharacterized protein
MSKKVTVVVRLISGMADMVNDKKLYYDTVRELLRTEDIRKLRNYPQHNGNNTLNHCIDVAKVSFALAERLHINIDEQVLARGAILHDYYLYDIDEQGYSDYYHGRNHPETALKNAEEKFILSEKEKNIIRGHMWPLTLFHPPKSREAWIVSLADKYCAIKEMWLHKKRV